MTLFPADEFLARIGTLQKYLKEQRIDAAVFNHPTDLLYYAGSAIPLYCVVPAEGPAFLLARKGSLRITGESSHELEMFANSRDLSAIMTRHGLGRSVRTGFALDVSSYASVERISKVMGSPAVADISGAVRALRMVKSAAEIEVMRKAGSIAARIPEIVREQYHEGITELELSAHIEFYLRKNGGGTIYSRQEGLLLTPGVLAAGVRSLSPNKFDGICAGTGVSPALPFGGSDEVIPANTPVICDYGFVLNGYHVDITRMFSIGEPPAEALKAHEAMCAVQNRIFAAMKPGVSCEDLWALAERAAEELGFGGQFMGVGSEKVRFVGHGLGVFLDEPPFVAPKMKDRLEADMVLAIEPKVSLPGIGVVGIENTVRVTEKGIELLTACSDEFYIL
jgi:Xaa-Pro aminopeptidase